MAVASAVAAAGSIAACVLGDIPPRPQDNADGSTGGDSGGGLDGTTAADGDAGPADSGAPPADGAVDAVGDVVVTWGDFADAASWTSFDTTTVSAHAAGFSGAVFDGQYVYFVPYAYSAGGTVYSGTVTRYDTRTTFADAGSWATFDTTSLDGGAGARGFGGGAFDGQYLYLVPQYNGAYDGIAARYDTHGTFGAAASWSTFDTTSVNPNARGLAYAAFDGRFVYFLPNYDGTPDSTVVRFDSRGDFADAGSWTTHDTTSEHPGTGSFQGGVFDGRYLYLVPYGPSSALGGSVTRYDTQAAFDAGTAWTIFDATQVSATAVGFSGGTFDGRYVYFVGGPPRVTTLRYDTSSDFGTKASWSVFEMTSGQTNGKNFNGAAFDGRYVYLGANGGPTARYDTEAPFDAGASWSTFEPANATASAANYAGTLTFDGRYVYLVPFEARNGVLDGLVLRFDAKWPPSLPPGPTPSFH
jgi:hypothetical protein